MLGPQRIVVDGTFAYFTDYDAQHGRVMRVPVAGGDAVEIAGLQVRPSAIAIDDLNVYWTDSLEGLVQRTPKGGAPIAALAPWQHHPEGIAARPEGVYWLNRGNPNDGEIVFLAVGASEPQVLVSSQKDSAQLAVDGSEIWWTNDGSQGSLNKMAQGSSVLEMFSIIDTPRALAIDAQSVYVATAGEIWRSDRTSGPFTVIASPAVAYGMTLDDQFVYWASPFRGINKVPLRGGATTHLVDDDLARDVAVDSSCVYWVSASGHVWRAPK